MKPKGLGAMLVEGKGAEAEGDEDDYEDGKSAAAEAVMSALEAGDAAGFASALTDFVALCK